MLRLKADKELLRLLGIKYDEAKKTGLLLAAAVAGIGIAVIALGLISRQIMMAAAGLVVVLVAPLMLMYPALETSSRIKRLEGELLPVAVYASLYTSAERDMSEGLFAFSKAENKTIAPTTYTFVTNLERWRVQKLIPTPHEALGDAARLLEGTKVAEVFNTMAVARTVGLSQYMQARDVLKSVLFELKSAYTRLEESMKLLGEVVLVFFGVLPLMLLIMLSIFYSRSAALQLPAYVFLGIPFMGIALAYLTDSAYPKTPESFARYYKMYLPAIAAGVVASVAAYFALLRLLPTPKLSYTSLLQSPGLYTYVASNIESSYALAIAVAVGAMVFGAVALPRYLAYSRWKWQVMSALPYFTRDLAELIKTGLMPAQAIMRIVERKRYNKGFDGVLKNIARRVAAGATFAEAAKQEASRLPWLAAVLFNSLGEAERLGAKHETFAELADISRDVVDIMKSAVASTRGAVIFGIITIVIIASMLGVVAKSLLFQVADYGTSFKSSQVQSAMPMNIQLIGWSDVPVVLRYSLLGAVLNSIVLGVLIGKIGDGNFTSIPLYVTIASALVIAALLISIFL